MASGGRRGDGGTLRASECNLQTAEWWSEGDLHGCRMNSGVSPGPGGQSRPVGQGPSWWQAEDASPVSVIS